ncbi:MAG: class I adenylate cyclase [Oligoflexales bacterium]
MEALDEEIVQNLKAYKIYNKQRINRLLTLMPAKKSHIFHILPFLTSVNIKGLPGYIDDPDAPCGIQGFKFKDELKQALEKSFPDHQCLKMSTEILFPKTRSISSLLLIGSLGTIAQSDKSDFDFWACVFKDKLSLNQQNMLQKKMTLIEEWAEECWDLEVHFFITDIQMVRNNDFGQAGGESAGSCIGKLLKEEFYRTSIHVMGKIPFWWIVPAHIDEKTYVRYKNSVRESKTVKPSLFVDLGLLSAITKDEFFGAAIWQISKAMDSPFKSSLKMGMLDVFIDPEVEVQLLCDSLKQKVQESKGSELILSNIDPYKIMVDTVLAYYKQKEKHDIHTLLQTCLFIKSDLDPGRIELHKDDLNFKEGFFKEYVMEWNWDYQKLMALGSFKTWSFHNVLALGKEVHNYLLKTYQNLSRLLKDDPTNKQLISDQDITVIGRKLDSFYSSKPAKIPFLKRAFASGLMQESLSFHFAPNKPKQVCWTLFRGQIGASQLKQKEIKDAFLKQGCNPAEMLVWCQFNMIMNKDTSIYLLPSPSPVTINDLQDLAGLLFSDFIVRRISDIKNEDLLKEAKRTKTLIIGNFSTNKTVRDVEELTFIHHNSWGEIYCFTKKGNPVNSIQESLAFTNVPLKDLLSKIVIHVPKGPNRKILEQKIMVHLHEAIK